MNQKSLLKCLWSTLFLVCLSILNACPSRLYSQSSTAEIQGTVADQNGHAVQGANVAVISDARVQNTVHTGADGKFDITGIPAGSYTVEISAPGFSTIQHSVSIAAGSNTSLPIALSVASVSEEVTVEAEGDTSIAAAACAGEVRA